MKQQQALNTLKELLELLMDGWSNAIPEAVYQMSERAAREYAEAFDEENAKGLGYGPHDKWMAMSRICWSGAEHAYNLTDAKLNIAKYVVQLESWVNPQ